MTGPDADAWALRQTEMLNWYANLLLNPSEGRRQLLADLEPLAEALARHRGRVLDVGGGLGLAQGMLPPGVDYTILEPATEWLRLRQLLGTDRSRTPSHRFVIGAGERMPFSSEHFDGVLVLWALNHVAAPSAVLRECARVLRRGGRLMLVLEDMEQRSGEDAAVVVASPQGDHVTFSEKQLGQWLRDYFVVAARTWSGPYLTFELIRESGYPGVPVAVVPVDFGDLRRVAPVSRGFGYSRGQPVDRVFIERFIAANANDIRGAVLEVGDSAYSRRYGCGELRSIDVLHLDQGHPSATICGDLADLSSVASESFDCIICTQTLQLIFDLHAAVRTLHRILRPGGVLLLTVPGISQIDDEVWQSSWCWSLTAASARRLFASVFGDQQVKVSQRGNVLVATAFLQGIAAEELTREELEFDDVGYPVIVAVRASRSLPTPGPVDA